MGKVQLGTRSSSGLFVNLGINISGKQNADYGRRNGKLENGKSYFLPLIPVY